VDFSRFLAAAHISIVYSDKMDGSKWMDIHQNNPRIKFLALNVDFSSLKYRFPTF